MTPQDKLLNFIRDGTITYQHAFGNLERLFERLEAYMKVKPPAPKPPENTTQSTGSTISIPTSTVNANIPEASPHDTSKFLLNIHTSKINEEEVDDESENTPKAIRERSPPLYSQTKHISTADEAGGPYDNRKKQASMINIQRKGSATEIGKTKDPYTPKTAGKDAPPQLKNTHLMRLDLDPAIFGEELVEFVKPLPTSDISAFYREVLYHIIETQYTSQLEPPQSNEIETARNDPNTILRITPRALLHAIFKTEVHMRNLLILTYDNYMTAFNLLIYLFKKLCEPLPLNLSPSESLKFLNVTSRTVKQRALSTLKYWLQERIDDFVTEPKLVTLLKLILEIGGEHERDQIIRDEMAFYLRIYLVRIEKLLTEKWKPRFEFKTPREDSKSIQTISPKEVEDKKISFSSYISSLFKSSAIRSTPFGRFIMEGSTQTIAEHIRLVNFRVFKGIPVCEFFQNRWDKCQIRRREAPQMAKLFNQSNILAYWVSVSIARQPDIHYAIMVIKRFMDIAEKAKDLQDYETAFEIFNRINMLSFHSLPIWNEIPWYIRSKLKELDNLFDANNNYGKFHDVFLASHPPCLPIFNYFLMKLRDLQKGEAVVIQPITKNRMINYQMHKSLADYFTKIRNFQSSNADLAHLDQDLYDYLSNSIVDELADNRIDTETFSNGDEIVTKLLAKLHSSLSNVP